MSPLVYALILIAAALAIEGLLSLASSLRHRSRAATRKRLRRMSRRLQSGEVEEETSLLRDEARGALAAWSSLLGSLPARKQLELRLYQAGLAMAPERFVAISAGLALGGWFVSSMFLDELLRVFAVAGVLGALPWIQLRRQRVRRRLSFERQFPEALDLLIRALRAGHSLSAGFAMVGNELPEPIGTEFAQLANEVQLGRPMREALANLAYRVESEDLPFFITAVAIQQETGSNLAEVLENLANLMRERFKLLGKVRALTAMGRASANILAAWPAVTFAALYFVNPGYLKPLWEEELGHTLVFLSVLLVVVGYVLCRKMATIRV